jgi:hypothetical protein
MVNIEVASVEEDSQEIRMHRMVGNGRHERSHRKAGYWGDPTSSRLRVLDVLSISRSVSLAHEKYQPHSSCGFIRADDSNNLDSNLLHGAVGLVSRGRRNEERLPLRPVAFPYKRKSSFH